MRLRSCLLVLLAVGFALPATAQRRWERDRYRQRWAPDRSTTEGFFLEGALTANRFTVDDAGDEETNDGGGAGLRLGYGFTRSVAAYVALQGAGMEQDNGVDYRLGHLDLGLQFSFAQPRQALVPYLNVGLSGVVAEYDDVIGSADQRFTGGALVVGGGLRYHLSRGVGLNLGLEGYGGAFNETTIDGDGTDVTTDVDDLELSGARLRVGLVWFPGAGRR